MKTSVVLFLLMLNGCMTSKKCPDVEEYHFVEHSKIREVPREHFRRFCPAGLACRDRNSGWIYIPEGIEEWEHELIYALGEEIWHDMGGEHEPRQH